MSIQAWDSSESYFIHKGKSITALLCQEKKNNKHQGEKKCMNFKNQMLMDDDANLRWSLKHRKCKTDIDTNTIVI